ncbi:MAG: hypothetical protein MZV49_27480 [Rhodopseudomonas palustris]|nr:hypothetical protein [Rhodopseudomonas palustris]
MPTFGASAVSLDAPEYFSGVLDYTTAAHAAKRVAQMVIANPLPKTILLNVNVPYLPIAELKGYRISRQGLRIYLDELVRREDPRGKTCITGSVVTPHWRG